MPLFLGLNPIDALIIVGSMIAVIAIGLYVSRGVKDESDYFVSGRSMGAVLQFFMNFGQATDSNGAPTIATEVYRQGVGGMWIGFQTLLATPFIWFTAIWFRRARVITGPDLFVDRFGSKRIAYFYAWFNVLQIPLTLGLGNIISYKVASATMIKPQSAYTAVERHHIADYHEYQSLRDAFARNRLPPSQLDRYKSLDSLAKKDELASFISYVSPKPFYLVYTLIVATYILLGGIKAAAVTDAFQGVLIIVFSVIMLPLGLAKVGGFHGLHQSLPPARFNLFGGAVGTEYTWSSIAALVFASILTFGAPTGPLTSSARDEKALRMGVLPGLFCKRFVMIAWMLCGLLAAAIFSNKLADPDDAWGSLATILLPTGLMGLMISGMLLGHMPAVGTNAVNFSAIFTRNLYEPLVPRRSQDHYFMIAKLATLLVLVLGVMFALFFTGVIPFLEALISFNIFFGVVGILIYFWRKLTAQAVGVGAVIWIVMHAVVAWGLPQIPSFRRLHSLTLQTQAYSVSAGVPATEGDVSAGRAERVGQRIGQKRIVPPASLFFESIALSDPSRIDSPVEGVGRFNVENYILYDLGLPLQRLGPGGLMTCRWVFDSLLPFALLMGISYLTQHVAERQPASATGDPAEPLSRDPFSTQALGLVEPASSSTMSQRDLRLARFYAKMKTPIAPTLEEDQKQVALSFADPTRFDHLKLFPNTCWEFTRWDRSDYLGFFGCWAGVLAVLWFLSVILRIGG
jgi:SSS family solute:Na+ symporter